jgi:hypothetical protein
VRSTSTELAHAVLQVGGRDLRAELNGKVPLTGSTRDGGVRGRQAPWVVTKEVGKRRRRSSADAAPETSPFCKFDRDLPRFLRISFSRSIFFRFSSADRQLATVGLRAAWNGYWTTALEPSANIIVSSGRASGRAGDSALSGPERSLDARADVLVVVLTHIIRRAFESFVTTTAR